MDLKNKEEFVSYHAASYVNEFIVGDSKTQTKIRETLIDFGKQLIDCLPCDGKESSHELGNCNKPHVSGECEHPYHSVLGDGEMQPAKCLKCGKVL